MRQNTYCQGWESWRTGVRIPPIIIQVSVPPLIAIKWFEKVPRVVVKLFFRMDITNYESSKFNDTKTAKLLSPDNYLLIISSCPLCNIRLWQKYGEIIAVGVCEPILRIQWIRSTDLFSNLIWVYLTSRWRRSAAWLFFPGPTYSTSSIELLLN